MKHCIDLGFLFSTYPSHLLDLSNSYRWSEFGLGEYMCGSKYICYPSWRSSSAPGSWEGPMYHWVDGGVGQFCSTFNIGFWYVKLIWKESGVCWDLCGHVRADLFISLYISFNISWVRHIFKSTVRVERWPRTTVLWMLSPGIVQWAQPWASS